MMFDTNCKTCRLILDHNSGGGPLEERFSIKGLATYDVDKAREMVKGRQAYELWTNDHAGWVSYGDDLNIMAVRVCESHMDHVPDTKDDPVIFAYSVRPREGSEKRRLRPIDGHHRIARAVKYNQPILYAVVLSEEETDIILTDHRPLRNKKRA